MISYIHGSEDSLDVDVLYVFDELPSFRECKEFCSADKNENRNIIVVKDGIVTECFKGTVDEINNGLLTTYYLHKQNHDLVVERKVERDILIKVVRVIRCLLSHCSRTKYRIIVKEALRSSNLKTKLETLKKIDFSSIDDYSKNGNKEDVYKTFAFQLGQVLGLFYNLEFYTKSSVANYFVDLKRYLYREKDASPEQLFNFIDVFIKDVENFEIIQNGDLTTFVHFGKTINLSKEEYVKINS